MKIDRRSFLSAAGSSLVMSAGSVWGAAAQAPTSPVSFPGIPNPLEGGVEVIATGYIWSEGPVWVGGEDGHLLFSDVPGNAIFSWDGKRTTVFIAPSGYQGFPIPASLREAGSNGLALGRGGLLIADSGTRVLARIDLATRQRAVLAESYQGKRFNSPNDLVVARNGDVYFTDPPFGLAGAQKSALRELTYTGVFRLTPDNRVHLITDKLSPNGIALSPDNLYSLRHRQFGLGGHRSRRFRYADRAAAVRRQREGGRHGRRRHESRLGRQHLGERSRRDLRLFTEGGTHRLRPDSRPRLELRVRARPVPLRQQRHPDGARPHSPGLSRRVSDPVLTVR